MAVGEVLGKAHGLIADRSKAIASYVETWYRYQALWDIDMTHVSARLGNDLGQWQLLLAEVRRARLTFDVNASSQAFGHAKVDFEQIQWKVSVKYDQWAKDLLSHFATIFQATCHSFLELLHQRRVTLERFAPLDAMPLTDLVQSIVTLQEMTTASQESDKTLDEMSKITKLLDRYKFNYPKEWLYFDQIEGEYHAVHSLLQHKNDALSQHWRT